MFRDPGGKLKDIDGRLIRTVNKSFAPDFRAFLDSSTARSFLERGRLVPTRLLNEIPDDPETEMTAEHQRLSFVSFPYEWPPEMLMAAGHLTLDLAESLLNEGMGLKDASPYNILFSGPKAVFVDVLSFEKRDARDPVWLPYAQFTRNFALPLLLNKHLGLTLNSVFGATRDGIGPEEAYRLLGPMQRLRPAFLNLVTLPAWLGARRGNDTDGLYRSRQTKDPEKARFILRSLFRNLRSALDSAARNGGPKSAWSGYMSCHTYSKEEFEAKDEFVRQALEESSPKRVLDVGCKSGASVVAVDSDAAAVGEAWRSAAAVGLDILPLVVDIARPSPATGWRNAENASFLERAAGRFDAVLMLAVVHHLLVSERVPLADILDLASELTTDLLLIEFVSPEDPMFRRIARGRDGLFTSVTAEAFESACGRRFSVLRSRELSSTRRVYCLKKKR